MSRTGSGLIGVTAAVALALSSAAIATSSPSAGPQADSAARNRSTNLTPAQLEAARAGFQVAPKGAAARRSATGKRRTPNPYLATLPDLTKADYATWTDRMGGQAAKRASSGRLARVQAQADPGARTPAVVHDEEEPAGTAGSNDTAAAAERIRIFGTRPSQNHRLRVLGELADLSGYVDTLPRPPEDNGSIPLSSPTGISSQGAIMTNARLGDGPHGRAGDGTNDFDFFAVDVGAGRSLTASTVGTTSGVDTVLAVYDATGELLATDDDSGGDLLSRIAYTPPAAGTYYVMVGGYSFLGPLPADPFDSGSGAGEGAEGNYRVSIAAARVDADYYAVQLRPGDVVGAVANGSADGLSITKPDGTRMVGAVGLDASFLYPPTSPLPGGGNTTLAYVAEEAGWYAIQVDGSTGRLRPDDRGLPPRHRERPRTAADGAARLRSRPGQHRHLGRARRARGLAVRRRSCRGGASTATASGSWRSARSSRPCVPTSRPRCSDSASTTTSTSTCSTPATTRTSSVRQNVSRVYVAGTIDETGHRHHRHRPVHRPGQLRSPGRGDRAARRAERPGRFRPGVAERLHHQPQRPGRLRVASRRQRRRARDRAHDR